MNIHVNQHHGEDKNGNQTFPAAFSSFAIVSTGFNLDRENRRKKDKENDNIYFVESKK